MTNDLHINTAIIKLVENMVWRDVQTITAPLAACSREMDWSWDKVQALADELELGINVDDCRAAISAWYKNEFSCKVSEQREAVEEALVLDRKVSLKEFAAASPSGKLIRTDRGPGSAGPVLVCSDWGAVDGVDWELTMLYPLDEHDSEALELARAAAKSAGFEQPEFIALSKRYENGYQEIYVVA